MSSFVLYICAIVLSWQYGCDPVDWFESAPFCVCTKPWSKCFVSVVSLSFLSLGVWWFSERVVHVVRVLLFRSQCCFILYYQIRNRVQLRLLYYILRTFQNIIVSRRLSTVRKIQPLTVEFDIAAYRYNYFLSNTKVVSLAMWIQLYAINFVNVFKPNFSFLRVPSLSSLAWYMQFH